MRLSRTLPGGIRLWHVLAAWAVMLALAAGAGLWIATSFHGAGTGGGCVVENRFGGCEVDDPGQEGSPGADDAGGGRPSGDGSELDNARR